MIRTRPRRDATLIGCAVLAVGLVWVPFFREAYGHGDLSLWDLRIVRPRAFWVGSGQVALVVSSVIAVLGARYGGARAVRLRWAGAGCAVAAVGLALVVGFVAASRVFVGSACFSFYSAPNPSDCSPFDVDYVPSYGWVTALLLATVVAITAAPAPRFPVRVSPRTASRLVLVGGLVLAVAAGAPVYRRDGTLFFHRGHLSRVVAASVLHSPYAVAAVVLGFLALGVAARRQARAAAVVAVLAVLAAVAAGAALPLDNGVGFRTVDGVRTSVSVTRPGWGYPVLLLAELLLAAGLVLRLTVADQAVGDDLQPVV